MKQLFEINGIKIYKGYCTNEFWIESDVFHSVDITHHKLYYLLETATNIVTDKTNGFVTFNQGTIKITAHLKDDATLAKGK